MGATKLEDINLRDLFKKLKKQMKPAPGFMQVNHQRGMDIIRGNAYLQPNHAEGIAFYLGIDIRQVRHSHNISYREQTLRQYERNEKRERDGR